VGAAGVLRNRNIAVLKQAFEKNWVVATPHAYPGQVAELARLYQSGRSHEIKGSALLQIQTASPQPSRVL